MYIDVEQRGENKTRLGMKVARDYKSKPKLSIRRGLRAVRNGERKNNGRRPLGNPLEGQKGWIFQDFGALGLHAGQFGASICPRYCESWLSYLKGWTLAASPIVLCKLRIVRYNILALATCFSFLCRSCNRAEGCHWKAGELLVKARGREVHIQ